MGRGLLIGLVLAAPLILSGFSNPRGEGLITAVMIVALAGAAGFTLRNADAIHRRLRGPVVGVTATAFVMAAGGARYDDAMIYLAMAIAYGAAVGFVAGLFVYRD